MNINTKWVRLGLSLVGVAGVGITSWLSIRSHEKAKDTQDSKSKLYCYAPAIASGVLTSACILGSHHLSSKQIAALTASCGYLAANRQKILAKAREQLGDEKVKTIQAEAAKETKLEQARSNKTMKPKIEETGHGHVHFIEDMFGREFYCSIEHFNKVRKMLNHLFMQGERVNYNTFYELLGLSKTWDGYEYEWPCNEDIYGYSIDEPIFFDRYPVEDENGETCWIVSCRVTSPVVRYCEIEG